MKTKPKPRARKMWANYYSSFPLPDVFQNKARAMSWATDYSATVKTVPVAVIPLDDVQSLIDRATGAHYNAVQAHPYHVPTPAAMIAALTAIGVLPRQSKGGAK